MKMILTTKLVNEAIETIDMLTSMKKSMGKTMFNHFGDKIIQQHFNVLKLKKKYSDDEISEIVNLVQEIQSD